MQLHLEDVSDKPQIIEKCHRYNYDSFGSEIGMEKYLEREKVFKKASDGQGKQSFFALMAETPTKDNCPEVYSACEVLSRPGLMNDGEKLVQIDVHTIGSVYTLSKHRGSGNASKLMQLIVEKLAAKETEILVLFSDVGSYYERFGYVTYDSMQLIIPPSESVLSKFQTPRAIPLEHKYDLSRVVALQDEQVRNEVERLGKGGCGMLPQFGTYEYFQCRNEFLAKALGRPSPKYYGYKLGTDWNASSIIYWHHWPSNTLKILSIFIHQDKNALEELAALLSVSDAYAKEMGLTKGLLLWAQDLPSGITPDQLIDFIGAGRVEKREDSLPAVHGKDRKWITGLYTWF